MEGIPGSHPEPSPRALLGPSRSDGGDRDWSRMVFRPPLFTALATITTTALLGLTVGLALSLDAVLRTQLLLGAGIIAALLTSLALAWAYAARQELVFVLHRGAFEAAARFEVARTSQLPDECQLILDEVERAEQDLAAVGAYREATDVAQLRRHMQLVQLEQGLPSDEPFASRSRGP